MHEPSKKHYTAAKSIIRYRQGTRQLGIKHAKEANSELIGYTNNDWVGLIDDCKRTFGYFLCFGMKPISWSSKKQKI